MTGCNGRGGKTGMCVWHRDHAPPEPPAPKPRPRKQSRPARHRTGYVFMPVCDECGAKDPRKSYRLDANLRPQHRLLCVKCRRGLGFAEVSYDRPYAEITARSIMRGAV